MKKTIISVITMALVMMGQCVAQDLEKVDSIRGKIITLNGTDTIVKNHRITIRSDSTKALILIHPTKEILQEFLIEWADGRLYRINNKCSLCEEDETIIFDGTMLALNGAEEYYVPSSEGNIIIKEFKYREMKEFEKRIFERAIKELLDHINQLP